MPSPTAHGPPSATNLVGPTDESVLLRHIYGRSAGLGQRFPHVLVGPGDDCAVVAHPGGRPLLITVDQLIEHRHFAPNAPLALIARKAIARSLSDIAAMGGSPAWSLATAMLPPGFPQADADALFDAIAQCAAGFAAPLVGGDIATGPASPTASPLVLTTTVGGTPHARRGPVRRSGVRPGDDLWITGQVGGSLASGRHLIFTPRLDEARALCDLLLDDLHAMIDVSDGVGIDGGRLATESGVRLEIQAALLPLHDPGYDPLRAIADGEDYELLFAAAPAARNRLESFPGITRIGRAIPQTAGTDAEMAACLLVLPDGRTVDATRFGWSHGRT